MYAGGRGAGCCDDMLEGEGGGEQAGLVRDSVVWPGFWSQHRVSLLRPVGLHLHCQCGRGVAELDLPKKFTI